MSFLFKSSPRKEDEPPAVSPPVSVPALRHSPMEADNAPTIDSPSNSTRMPTFHTGSFSSTSGVGSYNPSAGGGMLSRGWQGAEGGSSLPGTPPNELASTRQSSVSLSHNSSSAGSSSHQVGTGSLVAPSSLPLHPPHRSMIMGQQIGSSGSLHHIYQTNVVMTPSSSLPSTPNSAHSHSMYSLLGGSIPNIGSELSLAASSAQAAYPLHAPVPIAAGGSSSVRSSPHGSPSASPAPGGLPLALKIPQQNAGGVTPAHTTHTALEGTHPPAHPHTAHAQAHAPAATTAAPSPVTPAPGSTDEVAVIRAMFAGRQLSRSIFVLGDTLGTGTFGRVRIVTYHPDSQQSSAAVAGAPPTASPPAGAPTATRPLYFALKMLKKSEIIRLKQVEHIKAEKSILSRISHPFIVNLYTAFQDERSLYMTMEYVLGGELFSQLRKVGRFSNETARFYAAEIVLALDYLHSQSICYRDLKPENLLIDKEGHIKITDFGFAKVVEDRTWTLCGTPEYLAPEIIQSKGHGKAVDWWALGILIFEMLAGYPPFYDENPFGIYQKILKGVIDFPRHMDPLAKDLIKKLLTADRTKRFGCLQAGADDIKSHLWFKGVKWSAMFARQVKPPFVPAYRAPNDTSNFDRYPDSREGSAKQLSDQEKSLFADF